MSSTEQGPLDFGTQEWPHTDDQPVTEQLTYRNLGTAPVTLDLSVDTLSVKGAPAPDEAAAGGGHHGRRRRPPGAAGAGTVPDPAAENVDGMIVVGWERDAGLEPGLLSYGFPGFQSFTVGQTGPRVPDGQAFAQYAGTWSDRTGAAPVNYRLAWTRTGLLGGFSTEAGPEQLAEDDVTLGSPAAAKEATLQAQTFTPRGELVTFGEPQPVPPPPPPPPHGTDYVPGNGVKWSFGLFGNDGADLQIFGAGTYRPAAATPSGTTSVSSARPWTTRTPCRP